MMNPAGLARLLLLAGGYFAAGKLGLLLPIVQQNVTLLWAPTGIALGAVLLLGPRIWPGIALGAFLVNLSTDTPVTTSLAIGAGNTLEALTGGWLLSRAGFRTSLERVRDVLALVALGAVASPVVSAAIGVGSLTAAGLIPAERAPQAAVYWWLGDAMGALLVTPVLLSWAALPPRAWRREKILEAAALGVCLLVASVLTLDILEGNPILQPPLALTLFPCLVWAALRFGSQGAATATLLAVGIAVWATVAGLAPFARGTLEERLLYLHTYMAVAAVTSLLLAAIFAERKQAEEEIRESEERLRLALDAGRYGIWDWDIRGGRLTWSARLFDLHGVSPESFAGRLEDFTSLVHPDDAQRVDDAIRRALEERQVYHLEFRIVRPDGEVRWITTNGRALFDAMGHPVRMLGATLDVTERHQAEEERARLLAREREARAEAEAANEAKDRFLATLSHELRTPLTPVLAITSSLEKRGGLPQDLRRVLDVIRRNVELEARLIDDLLDLTRIARGKLELHPEVVDARKVVEHTLEICCEREAASGRLRLVTDLAAADHRVWADPSRLTQVLWNLLNNAVKFTPAGGTIIVRSWSGEGRLLLQVSDTGVGIDAEVLPQIFGAFEQGRVRSLRGIGGLGLGLAISRAIVGMHGGTLTAESEGRGRGATFTVSLPASLPREAGTGQISAPGGKTREAAPARGEGNLRILLVEDHADTAEAMADLLGLLGHEVTVAGGVAAALAAAGQARKDGGFDLMISDLGLPDGTGFDLMRELEPLPSIALSGYGMEEDIRQSHEAGFRKHLIKPVNLRTLKAAIEEVAGSGEFPET